MKKSLILILASAMTMLLAGSCCPCRKASNKNHKPLTATEWSLVQMEGRNITADFTAEECPRLVLATDGSFGGYGGCNSMGGEYKLTPSEAPSQRDKAGVITLGNIFSTKRMCPNDRLEMEFFTLLSKVDAYTIEGSKLFLFDDGELKLVFDVKK